MPAACPPVISGCTDLAAPNYLPEATVDDGTCRFGGCTSPIAPNYDASAAFDDATCETPSCADACGEFGLGYYEKQVCVDACTATGGVLRLGCTDPAADNYSPSLNAGALGPYFGRSGDSHFGCVYYGCTDPTNANYDASANFGDDFYACTRRRRLSDVSGGDGDGATAAAVCAGCRRVHGRPFWRLLRRLQRMHPDHVGGRLRGCGGCARPREHDGGRRRPGRGAVRSAVLLLRGPAAQVQRGGDEFRRLHHRGHVPVPVHGTALSAALSARTSGVAVAVAAAAVVSAGPLPRVHVADGAQL